MLLLDPGQRVLYLVVGWRRGLELDRSRGRGEKARVRPHDCLVLEGHASLFHHMCLVVLRTAPHHFLFDEKVEDQADHHDGEGSRGQDD